jgi:hypothetical protein
MRSTVQRQIGDNDSSHVVVAGIAHRFSRDYRDAFVVAMEEFRTHYPEEALVELIRDQGVDAADGIDFNELAVLFATMAAIHERAARASGAATAIGISEATGTSFDFLMTSEMSDRLQTVIGEDLQFLIQSTKRGASTMVELMLEDGLSPEEAGRRLHLLLGVDQNRMRKWRKFEAQMRKAGLLEEPELSERIDEFAEALLWDRGRVAGGDEVWGGTQQGRQFGLEAGITAGALLYLSVKVWNTMRDEHVCPRCGPMHGQRVPITASFQSPYDGSTTMWPQLHGRCRCWTTWSLL